VAIEGETIGTGAPDVCPECGKKLEMQVLRSNAWYIGTECCCGPYSRESGYYETREEAETALRLGTYGR
jgi:hypothetical protein